MGGLDAIPTAMGLLFLLWVVLIVFIICVAAIWVMDKMEKAALAKQVYSKDGRTHPAPQPAQDVGVPPEAVSPTKQPLLQDSSVAPDNEEDKSQDKVAPAEAPADGAAEPTIATGQQTGSGTSCQPSPASPSPSSDEVSPFVPSTDLNAAGALPPTLPPFPPVPEPAGPVGHLPPLDHTPTPSSTLTLEPRDLAAEVDRLAAEVAAAEEADKLAAEAQQQAEAKIVDDLAKESAETKEPEPEVKPNKTEVKPEPEPEPKPEPEQKEASGPDLEKGDPQNVEVQSM